MTVQGASFVRIHQDRATSMREVSRVLRETNENWLAASSTNLAVELVVRSTEGSDWISIQRALAAPLLETLSRELHTTAIQFRVMNEMVLRFSYGRFDNGRALRALEYSDEGNPSGRGQWIRVEGVAEAWESILFSPRLLALYRKSAPDELAGSPAENTIQPGFSIPWPCDPDALAEIARTLELPWQPTDHRFPPAEQTEIIPGSPERWQALQQQRAKPWWKFWARGVGRSSH